MANRHLSRSIVLQTLFEWDFLNGKDVDVFHVINEDGKQELWVLNNAAFPLIIQSTGQATDIVMSEIK